MSNLFQLFCWIVGSEAQNVFTIDIPKEVPVAKLKDAIKDKKIRVFQDIEADALVLYKVTIPKDDIKVLETIDLAGLDVLWPTHKISRVFSDSLPDNNIDIVIVRPPAGALLRHQRSISTGATAELKQPPEGNLLDRLRVYLNTSPYALNAPSQVAIPSAVQRILNDRPDKDVQVTPIALLYRPFGQFLDYICDRAEENDGVDLEKLENNVDQFASVMCRFYQVEDDRRDNAVWTLNEIFTCYEPFRLPSIVPAADIGGGLHSGGHANGPAQVMETIVEARNELGVGDADPEVQLATYFLQMHHHHSTSGPHKSLYDKFPFPALGISIIGSYVGFSALILLDQPRFVALTPLLPARFPSGDESTKHALLRAFRAACVLRSNIHNDTLRVMEHPPAVPRELNLPYVQSIPTWPPTADYGGDQLEFSLQVAVGQSKDPDQWNEKRLLYGAKTEGDQEDAVLVKFTRRYCPELHHFCAEQGHAPKLLGYGIVPGGWNVAVMELVLPAPLAECASAHWTKWKEDLTRLVDGFHGLGLVHGDLRDANMIVPRDDPGRIMLVDFDWSGESGKVSFPTYRLNKELLTDGKKLEDLMITKEHDDRVLAVALEKLRPRSSLPPPLPKDMNVS